MLMLQGGEMASLSTRHDYLLPPTSPSLRPLGEIPETLCAGLFLRRGDARKDKIMHSTLMTSKERQNEEKHMLIISALLLKARALKNNENGYLILKAFALAPTSYVTTLEVISFHVFRPLSGPASQITYFIYNNVIYNN